jgi:polyisoprenoid-binding protein YceI
VSKKACLTALALALGVAATVPALAPKAIAAAAPSKDPATAPAGTYNLDTQHSSVIGRIAHGGGTSFSTLRFGITKAVLNWDPANPANIKLEATLDAKPHYDPIVYRVTPESEQLLNVAKFPTATFSSTRVTKTGATTADVTGNFSLLGVTKPVVLHLELVGVGQGPQGKKILGFTGKTEIKRSDFGMSFGLPSVGDVVSLQLDGEFQQQG